MHPSERTSFPASIAPASGFRPVSGAERVEVLDALRGFALLGILLVNIWSLSRYEWLTPEQVQALPTHAADRVVKAILAILIDTKFMTIFSFLFGVGFAIQLERAGAKGVAFGRYFLWRMVLLFVIASLHAYLLWFGDIIRFYAMIGAALLLVRRWPARRLLWGGIVLAVGATAIVFIVNGLVPFPPLKPPAGVDMPLMEYLNYAFTEGSYREMLRANWLIDPLHNFPRDAPLTLTSAGGKMLLGFWMARTGLFSDPARFGPMLRRWQGWGLTLGLPASLAYWAILQGHLSLDSPWLLWVPFAVAGGMILHSLFYVSVFIRLFDHPRAQRCLQTLRPVGRMALTNYIGQTLICFGLFYGLGLTGRVGPGVLLPASVLIFAGQMAFSRWWLQRYEQGPLEALWRKMAYFGARPESNGASHGH